MSKIIPVRMGELIIDKKPQQLGCNGLGSCIGLIIYDEFRKIGGLAHIILPTGGKNGNNEQKPGKYADLAIPHLIENLGEAGAHPRRLWAKMAGGAHMFSLESENDISRIGERNIEAVREILKQYRRPVKAMDVGGKSGRTIVFYLSSGKLKIKTFQKGEKIL